FLTLYVFFFVQAEDGIRDATVTGVQTCALPILVQVHQELIPHVALEEVHAGTGMNLFEGNVGNQFLMDLYHGTGNLATLFRNQRSEERRVGKECRPEWRM